MKYYFPYFLLDCCLPWREICCSPLGVLLTGSSEKDNDIIIELNDSMQVNHLKKKKRYILCDAPGLTC